MHYIKAGVLGSATGVQHLAARVVSSGVVVDRRVAGRQRGAAARADGFVVR